MFKKVQFAFSELGAKITSALGMGIKDQSQLRTSSKFKFQTAVKQWSFCTRIHPHPHRKLIKESIMELIKNRTNKQN